VYNREEKEAFLEAGVMIILDRSVRHLTTAMH
jgi:hypothetical protein